jgi:hypothetical protein
MRDVTPRRESRKPRTERLSRQSKKPFDKGAAFAATRREIERHAKYVGAGDTDDFSEGVHVVVSQREASPSASPPEGGLPRAAAPPKKGRGLPSSRTAVTVAGHACVADPQPEPCPIWAHQRLPMELRLLALGLPVPENLARAA